MKAKRKPGFEVGVSDPKLGSEILEKTRIPCVCKDLTGELLRGIRVHFTKLLKQLKDPDLDRSGNLPYSKLQMTLCCEGHNWDWVTVILEPESNSM